MGYFVRGWTLSSTVFICLSCFISGFTNSLFFFVIYRMDCNTASIKHRHQNNLQPTDIELMYVVHSRIYYDILFYSRKQ